MFEEGPMALLGVHKGQAGVVCDNWWSKYMPKQQEVFLNGHPPCQVLHHRTILLENSAGASRHASNGVCLKPSLQGKAQACGRRMEAPHTAMEGTCAGRP